MGTEDTLAYPRPLSASEAAEYLGISMRTLYDLGRAGDIPAVKLGHRWYFSQRKLARSVGVDGDAKLTPHA